MIRHRKINSFRELIRRHFHTEHPLPRFTSGVIVGFEIVNSLKGAKK
jgi:hypothetical protein